MSSDRETVGRDVREAPFAGTLLPLLRAAAAYDRVQDWLEHRSEIRCTVIVAPRVLCLCLARASTSVLDPGRSLGRTALRDAALTKRLARCITAGDLIRGKTLFAPGRSALALSASSDCAVIVDSALVAAGSTVAVINLEVLHAVAVPARRAAQTNACLFAVALEVAQAFVAGETGAADCAVRALASAAHRFASGRAAFGIRRATAARSGHSTLGCFGVRPRARRRGAARVRGLEHANVRAAGEIAEAHARVAFTTLLAGRARVGRLRPARGRHGEELRRAQKNCSSERRAHGFLNVAQPHGLRKRRDRDRRARYA
jgi:hypothetical protein